MSVSKKRWIREVTSEKYSHALREGIVLLQYAMEYSEQMEGFESVNTIQDRQKIQIALKILESI